MRVLIVDDAMFMRITLKNILLKEGLECHEASSGAEAVQRYEELKPDLVLMDITMPEMDGITAVREIKKRAPHAKFIMCSAMGQQAMIVDAVTAGASDFVVKPFKPERVLEAVYKILGTRPHPAAI
jgi:two-component system chemotaxis response regulator CheY